MPKAEIHAYTFAEAARASGKTQLEIERAVDDGRLPAHNAGPYRLILSNELNRFVAAQQTGKVQGQSASALINMAKQAAARAGRPVVNHGPGIVGLARKAAAEFEQ